VSAGTPALLLAAAGVAVGHAVLPDHWLPLAVLGRTRSYPLGRVARISGLAGLAHVLVSVVLGAVIIVVGLQFRSAVQGAQDAIVGAALIGTGAVFTVLELTGRGHAHHGHGHEHRLHAHRPSHHHHGHRPDNSHAHGHGPDSSHAHGHGPDGSQTQGHARALTDSGVSAPVAERPSGLGGLAAVMIPFGAAASPDLTILPVFLAATTLGAATAVGSVLVFGLVTVLTIVALTLVAARGGYEIRGQWLERWGNLITAAVLVAIGVLVLLGVI
jgi:nickel/cobalt transporter (NicO) family protein